MQQLVNTIYAEKKRDKLLPVSRSEFEQRDIRNKLDLADIYLQLEQIKGTLAQQGLTIEEIPEREKAIVEMVQEDRRIFQEEMAVLKHQRKVSAGRKGSMADRWKRFVYGIPQPGKSFVPKTAPVSEPIPAQPAVSEPAVS